MIIETSATNPSKAQRRALLQTKRFRTGITELIALINLGKKSSRNTFFNKSSTFELDGHIVQSPKERPIQKIAKELN